MRYIRRGELRLELLLVLAVAAFFLQLFPSLWVSTLRTVDVRNWPRPVWFAVTWMALLALLAIRFGPDVYQEWRQRRDQRAAEHTKRRKQQELRDQRETLARMKEAMKRRVV